MKEQFVSSSELTRRQPYSTLNTAHSLPNERFIMDSAPKENRPKFSSEHRNQSRPQAFSPELELAHIIAERVARNEDQAAAESRRVLDEMGAKVSDSGGHPFDALMKQKAENPLPNINPVPSEHPDDKALREKMIQAPKDAQLHPDLKDVALITPEFPYGDTLDAPDITDPDIRSRLVQIQRNLNTELAETEGIKDVLKAAPDFNKLIDTGVDPEQVKKGLAYLKRFRNLYEVRHKTDQEDKRFRGFSLQWKDMKDIDEMGPAPWLDGQFDILYDLAEKGGELLDSPQVRAIEAKFNEAVGYLLLEGKPIEQVVEIQNKYNIQTSLFFMSASVGRRNLEGIQGSAVRLKTEGLFTALSFNGGRVGSMLNRMADMVNVARVSEGGFVEDHDHHVTTLERQHLDNKMVNVVKGKLIAEQFNLAVYAKAGSYADRYEILKDRMRRELKVPAGEPLGSESEKQAQEYLRREIRGNVNVAHDAYLVTQMQAIEASKGRRIEKHPYAFFTDPKGIFDFLNIEEFLTNKWGTLNHEQMLFLRQIKLDLAMHDSKKGSIKGMTRAQLVELGTRKFKELFTVPDFYSSGWRIEGIRDHIARLQEYHLQNDRLSAYVGGVDDSKLGLTDDGGIPESLTPGQRRDNDVLQSLQDKINTIREDVKDLSPDDKRRMIAAKNTLIDNDVSMEDDLKEVAKEEYRLEIMNRVNLTPDQKKKRYLDFIKNNLTLDERNMYVDRTINSDDKITINLAAKRNAGEFALFLALKAAGPDSAMREAAWKKIQKYKPEEMIRFVRERKGLMGEVEELRIVDKIFTAQGINGDTKTDFNGNKLSIHAADVFRRDYLPAISMIREAAFREVPPRQIDFRDLDKPENAQYKEQINKALKGVWTPDAARPGELPTDMLIKLYKGMDKYISEKKITKQFISSTEYEDLGARVQKSDDLLLDQLEVVPENMAAGNVSSYWTSEAAGDALVRNYNDIKNAQEAGGHLVKFLTTEGSKDEFLKAATAFAHSVKEYNGWEGAAKAMRFTFGSYLLMAEQDYGIDILGVGKIGRLATSDLQRILGQGVDSITREQMLNIMDHIRGHLTTNDHDDPEKYYNELMNQLGVDGLSRLKDKSTSAVIYLAFLFLLGTSLAAGTAAFKEASK